MMRYSWLGGPYDPRQVRNLESGGIFWHVVDLLWIVLFALLYLVK
jgi:nitric oxide reductase NorE protein